MEISVSSKAVWPKIGPALKKLAQQVLNELVKKR